MQKSQVLSPKGDAGDANHVSLGTILETFARIYIRTHSSASDSSGARNRIYDTKMPLMRGVALSRREHNSGFIAQSI